MAPAIGEVIVTVTELKNFPPLGLITGAFTDLKDGLYKSKRINITEMKHIESLASVGNDAAHNKPTLTESDVKRLLRDVRDILVKYPLLSA